MIWLNSMIEMYDEPRVAIRLRPTHGVFPWAAHRVREMHVVPACLQLGDLTDNQSQSSPFFIQFGAQRFAMIPPSAEGKVCSMAFHIRSSAKLEECNCSIEVMKSYPHDYPSVISGTIIVNHKHIRFGQELVLYDEVAAAVASESEPAAKRAKGSDGN